MLKTETRVMWKTKDEKMQPSLWKKNSLAKNVQPSPERAREWTRNYCIFSRKEDISLKWSNLGKLRCAGHLVSISVKEVPKRLMEEEVPTSQEATRQTQIQDGRM